MLLFCMQCEPMSQMLQVVSRHYRHCWNERTRAGAVQRRKGEQKDKLDTTRHNTPRNPNPKKWPAKQTTDRSDVMTQHAQIHGKVRKSVAHSDMMTQRQAQIHEKVHKKWPTKCGHYFCYEKPMLITVIDNSFNKIMLVLLVCLVFIFERSVQSYTHITKNSGDISVKMH